MTNYERIKAMSIEEMTTAILNEISYNPCDYCNYSNGYCNGEPCKNKTDDELVQDWLEREATE